MMKDFPDKLDNAIVLEFSEFGNYGTIKGDDRAVRYFAICQYPNDAGYYLFFCAGYEYDFDVIIDDFGKTIEMCKKRVAQYGDVVWQKNKIFLIYKCIPQPPRSTAYKKTVGWRLAIDAPQTKTNTKRRF